MKYEVRRVKDGIMQITTSDERWYHEEAKGIDIYRPSATWIAGYYPKGIGYFRWLAEHGWDEAEAIKREAGERGSKVHQAIDTLIKGEEVHIDSKFVNNTTGQEEELTADEYFTVMTFKEWFDEEEPIVLGNEFTVSMDKCEGDKDGDPNRGVAGTVDLHCILPKHDNAEFIIDIKTSQNIFDSHRIQVNEYKLCMGKQEVRMGILQVNYRLNKTKKYKFTEIEDDVEGVNIARAIWRREVGKIVPLQKDYPLTLKLDVKKQ
jgi:hypothetical protein